MFKNFQNFLSFSIEKSYFIENFADTFETFWTFKLRNKAINMYLLIYEIK